jgi:hypothetical protein
MNQNLDPQLVKWALVCSAAIIGLATMAFTVVGSIAFWKAEKGTARSFGLLFQRGNLLRVITAVLVIESAVILSLAGALSQGTTAILSAVAGFVLGGLDKQRVEDSATEHKDGE